MKLFAIDTEMIRELLKEKKISIRSIERVYDISEKTVRRALKDGVASVNTIAILSDILKTSDFVMEERYRFGEVAYVCNRMACGDKCPSLYSDNDYCRRTTNINYAVNFKPVGNGMFAEVIR